MYDALDGGAAAEALGFPELRSALLSRARGRTLETAVGTGLNLPLYPGNEGSVSSLTAVDVSRGMLERARARAAGVGTAVAQQATFVEGDVARLPFESDSFDTGERMALVLLVFFLSMHTRGHPSLLRAAPYYETAPSTLQAPSCPAPSHDPLSPLSAPAVLDTFSLCVFPDPSAALREMGRVLQPFGSLLLLEHSRSDNPLLASYQDLTSGAVAATAKGCVWNQDVEGMVRAAGMEVVNARRAAAGTVVLLEARKRPA